MWTACPPIFNTGNTSDFKELPIIKKLFSIYTFETGSQIEFFSADQPDKLRGTRRDRCFMNEANNMELDTFDQLEVRTKEFMIIGYNPTNEF